MSVILNYEILHEVHVELERDNIQVLRPLYLNRPLDSREIMNIILQTT